MRLPDMVPVVVARVAFAYDPPLIGKGGRATQSVDDEEVISMRVERPENGTKGGLTEATESEIVRLVVSARLAHVPVLRNSAVGRDEKHDARWNAALGASLATKERGKI